MEFFWDLPKFYHVGSIWLPCLHVYSSTKDLNSMPEWLWVILQRFLIEHSKNGFFAISKKSKITFDQGLHWDDPVHS